MNALSQICHRFQSGADAPHPSLRRLQSSRNGARLSTGALLEHSATFRKYASHIDTPMAGRARSSATDTPGASKGVSSLRSAPFGAGLGGTRLAVAAGGGMVLQAIGSTRPMPRVERMRRERNGGGLFMRSPLEAA